MLDDDESEVWLASKVIHFFNLKCPDEFEPSWFSLALCNSRRDECF